MVKQVATAAGTARWKPQGPHATEDSASPTVSREMVQAVMPEQILHEDEVVLLLTKPSLWFIVLTSFRFVLAVTLLGVLVVKVFELGTSGSVTPGSVGMVTALLCLGRVVWAILVWTSHTYMLTNLRVVTIKGVVNVAVFQAPLRKIQRTVLYKPLAMRLFGVGTIGFATAATTDFDSTWVMVGRPVAVHETVVAAINKAG
jgi:uncharacterized membrane protein YdbT with pleckstrin-like domain